MAQYEIILPQTEPETEWIRGRPLQKLSPHRPAKFGDRSFRMLLTSQRASSAAQRDKKVKRLTSG